MAANNLLNVSSDFSSEPQSKLRSADPDSLWHENRRLQGDLERSLIERNRLLKRIQEMNAAPRRNTGSRILEQRLSDTRADVDSLSRDNAVMASKVAFLQERLERGTRQQRVLISRLREAVEMASGDAPDPAGWEGELPDDADALADCSNRIMESLWRILANNDAFQGRALKEQAMSLKGALAEQRDEVRTLRQEKGRLEKHNGDLSRELEQYRSSEGLRDQRLNALKDRVVELEEESNRLTRSNLKLKSQVKALRGAVDPDMFSYVASHTVESADSGNATSGVGGVRGTLLGALVGALLTGGGWQLFSSLGNDSRPIVLPTPAAGEQTLQGTGLRRTAASSPDAPEPALPERRQQRQDGLRGGGVGPELVLLAGGSFRMGSDRYGRADGEGPSRPAQVDSVWMSRYEVRFSDFDRFARATGRKLPDDKGWGRGNRPAVNVTWDDAVAYAAWLSAQTGERYRLPNESEWEYAVAGGAAGIYWWGNSLEAGKEVCLNCGSPWDGRGTAPVGSLDPNPMGLYDMGGNVMEWVADCMEQVDYTGRCGLRVVRGGAFDKPGNAMRTTARRGMAADVGYPSVGFRLVREL